MKQLSIAVGFLLATIQLYSHSVTAGVFTSRDNVSVGLPVESRINHQDERIVARPLKDATGSELTQSRHELYRKKRDVIADATTTTLSTPDVSVTEDDVTEANLTYEYERDRQNTIIIEAIMQSILEKLNMTQIPDMSNVNSTVAERRKVIRLYRRSLEELQAKRQSGTLFIDEESTFANQFHSFTDNGMLKFFIFVLIYLFCFHHSYTQVIISFSKNYFAMYLNEAEHPLLPLQGKSELNVRKIKRLNY